MGQKHMKGCLFRVLVCPGWPKVMWFVTESKHLSKPPRDWFPLIKEANQDTAYIEVTDDDKHDPLQGVGAFPLLLFRHEINTPACPLDRNLTTASPFLSRPPLSPACLIDLNSPDIV